MKRIFFLIPTRTIVMVSVILLVSGNIFGQKVFTKNGNISFFSKSPLENISSENNQVVSILNKQTGDYQFSVLIKGFHFKKALMEEHFNESYLESDKFPKAVFKGVLENIAAIDFTKDGVYRINVTGDLTIHGVTNKITAPGIFTIKAGKVIANSLFKVKTADYKIKIPTLVKDNIAEVIDINVSCVYNSSI